MWKTGLICFVLFFVFVVSVFGIKKYKELLPEERTANRMLKKTQEKDLLALLEKYYDAIINLDVTNLYEIDENKNEYVLSQTFNTNVKPIIDEIKEFHCNHHNNNQIPRDTEEWKKWIACLKSVNTNGDTFIEVIENTKSGGNKRVKNNLHISFCPYCLAIEEMNISDDSVPDFEDTYLVRATKYRKQFYKGLLSITKEKELRNLMDEKLLPILNNDSMFSVIKTQDAFYQYELKTGDYCYLKMTQEFKNAINDINSFHKTYHNQIRAKDFENIWMHDKRLYEKYMVPEKKTDWWSTIDETDEYKDDNEFIKQIQQDNITVCPVCILLDDIARNREGVAKDGLTYSDTYTFSNMAMSRYYDYIDRLEEVINAVSIKKIGDLALRDEYKTIQEWNNKRQVFYGKIAEISEIYNWYDDNNQLHEETMLSVYLYADSSWRDPTKAHFNILLSKIPKISLRNFVKGQEIYIKGTLKINSYDEIEIKNVSIPNPDQVKYVKQKLDAKRQAEDDGLMKAFADWVIGGATPLTTQDFED